MLLTWLAVFVLGVGKMKGKVCRAVSLSFRQMWPQDPSEGRSSLRGLAILCVAWPGCPQRCLAWSRLALCGLYRGNGGLEFSLFLPFFSPAWGPSSMGGPALSKPPLSHVSLSWSPFSTQSLLLGVGCVPWPLPLHSEPLSVHRECGAAAAPCGLTQVSVRPY